MAQIDTNPATPVWPRRPMRKVDPDDKASEDRRQRQQQSKKQNKQQEAVHVYVDGDETTSFPRIDEYA